MVSDKLMFHLFMKKSVRFIYIFQFGAEKDKEVNRALQSYCDGPKRLIF